MNGAFPKLVERRKSICLPRRVQDSGSEPPKVHLSCAAHKRHACKYEIQHTEILRYGRAAEGGKRVVHGAQDEIKIARNGIWPGLPIQAIVPRGGDVQSASGKHIWKLLPVEDDGASAGWRARPGK